MQLNGLCFLLVLVTSLYLRTDTNMIYYPQPISSGDIQIHASSTRSPSDLPFKQCSGPKMLNFSFCKWNYCVQHGAAAGFRTKAWQCLQRRFLPSGPFGSSTLAINGGAAAVQRVPAPSAQLGGSPVLGGRGVSSSFLSPPRLWFLWLRRCP